MNRESRTCQNCKTEFFIEPEDFKFYEKISVPPPTWCPECRMVRRMNFRSERTLYQRKCDLCRKDIISMFRGDVPFPVYCQDCWYSDKWDPLEYSSEFSQSESFLKQFHNLQNRVPRSQYLAYASARLVGSPYTNCSGDLENCYLIFGALNDRNCAYSHYINDSRDCFDVLYSMKSERCYECFDIENCYNLIYSQSCQNCIDSAFLFDCRNCQNCIGCAGLRNKSYYIFNKPYTKEEYQKKKSELGLNSHQGIAAFRKKYLKEIFPSSPRKYYHGQMNSGFSGDYISNAEKTFQAFYTKNTRNVKFSFWCVNGRDVYDYLAWGDLERSYECVSSGDKSYEIKLTHGAWGGSYSITYCSSCVSSNNLFACIGLRNKSYCILNKQYTKEEYLELVPRIIKHMNSMPYIDKKGRVYKYGEFFPPELSPFAYNETIAQEYFPLTKEQAIEQGYSWKDPEPRNYQITLKNEDIPDHIKDVKDDILNQIIGCAHEGKCNEQCTEAYRIIPQELDFLRKQNLPIPRLCPNCRHYQRIKQRNPLKLWHRKCMCAGNKSSNQVYINTIAHEHGESHCDNSFETTYAPERKEIIYCEQCYLKEVV